MCGPILKSRIEGQSLVKLDCPSSPHRTVEEGAATNAAPLFFGCAMLPCWMCVALQARHSSEDFQTSSVARRDLVSHRVLDDDGCFTPLPGECEHARPVLDDMTLGDGHPSFRAEGDGSARYKQA
jgi:hypothetical protein